MLRICFIIMALAACVGLGIGIYHVVGDYNRDKDAVSHQIYSGREYLQEREYQEFKKYLADNLDVEIRELEVLASDNPLVTFEVITYGGKEFPWGEVKTTVYEFSKGSLAFSLALMGMGLMIFLGILVGTYYNLKS